MRDTPMLNSAVRLTFHDQGRVPHIHGFPVKFVGVDVLHAAFLKESRTRSSGLVPRTGNPCISLVFREMWDTTNADLRRLPHLL
jgi:hypothetical protein